MPTRDESPTRGLLQGTLDLLILRTLLRGPQHGHGIVLAIEGHSDHALLVDHGSLYPALQRLEKLKWISGTWGTSSNNRRARFYELTKAGRRELEHEASAWHTMVRAMAMVLGPEFAGR